MESVIELRDICMRLSEPNKFAVLVYARMKYALQMAEMCKPYMFERRKSHRLQFPSAHWVYRAKS